MSKRHPYKLKISLSIDIRAIAALIRAIAVLLPAVANLPSDDGPVLPREPIRRSSSESETGLKAINRASAPRLARPDIAPLAGPRPGGARGPGQRRGAARALGQGLQERAALEWVDRRCGRLVVFVIGEAEHGASPKRAPTIARTRRELKALPMFSRARTFFYRPHRSPRPYGAAWALLPSKSPPT